MANLPLSRPAPDRGRMLAGLAQAEHLIRAAFPGHPWVADAVRDAAHFIRTART